MNPQRLFVEQPGIPLQPEGAEDQHNGRIRNLASECEMCDTTLGRHSLITVVAGGTTMLSIVDATNPVHMLWAKEHCKNMWSKVSSATSTMGRGCAKGDHGGGAGPRSSTDP
jgi:hypothetical protein